MFIYYIYAYINSETGLPYYIGKGKNKRAFEKHRNVTTPENKNFIILLETNLSEIGAFALERRYIKWFGRKINNTGILDNITDGGPSGKSIPLSDSFKEKCKLRELQKIKSGTHPFLNLETRRKVNEYLIVSGKHPFLDKEKARKRQLKRVKEGIHPFVNSGEKSRLLEKERLEKGIHYSQKEYLCPHCNKEGRGNAMLRHHMNNCKKLSISSFKAS